MNSQFDLKVQTYSIPKLTLLSWGLLAAALGSAIASHYGSYPKSADLCFYPVAAQNKDHQIKEQQTENSLLNVNDSQRNLNSKLSLGAKFCNIRRGDVGTIPQSYINKALHSSVNDRASDLALVSQGLREGWLYQLHEIPAENPHKILFGWLTFGFGSLSLWAFRFTQDQLSLLRPKYRATHRLASIQSGFALSFAEADLKMSAELLLVKLRGLREADARKVFLASLTDEQAFSLLSSMDAQDYTDFGYLIDGGASFGKFLSPSDSAEATLDNSAVYETVGDIEDEDLPQERPQYTRTDNLPREDKYEPFRQQGLSIIKQAGSPGKCKALIAPSRTGKTTVVYFMIEETIKLVGEENLTCYVWQGKGIEPVHPNIPRKNHNGFTLKNFGLESLNLVWDEYETRQELLEKGYRDFAPVLLIITDWQSIKDQLSSQDKETFKDVTAKIMTLANNGAALGTTVWLDTQSPNVNDWGLGSASIRDNFDIFAIARIGNDSNGQIIGDTKCITKVLQNDYLVPSESDRTKAVEQYNFLLEGMQNKKITTSVILSTAGVVRLGITPKFERKALQFENTVEANKPTEKPADIWTEPTATTEPTKPVEPPKVSYVKSETNGEIPMKQRVQKLVKSGKNYKQICSEIWGDKPIEQIAPMLGSCCRLDKINILSECASFLLNILRGNGWVDISGDWFISQVVEELADFQVNDGLQELLLLGYIQADNTNVRALY
jgi:hypothetical protein